MDEVAVFFRNSLIRSEVSRIMRDRGGKRRSRNERTRLWQHRKKESVARQELVSRREQANGSSQVFYATA
jgi:hypothetical protein